MPHDIFEHLLADDICEFTRLYPEIEINLQVAKGLKNLGRREADLAIRLTPNPPDYLVGQRVVDLQHAIYAPASMNLDSEVPLVLWSDEQELPDWAMQHFSDASIALRVDDLYSMYCAACTVQHVLCSKGRYWNFSHALLRTGFDRRSRGRKTAAYRGALGLGSLGVKSRGSPKNCPCSIVP